VIGTNIVLSTLEMSFSDPPVYLYMPSFVNARVGVLKASGARSMRGFQSVDVVLYRSRCVSQT